VLGAKSSWTATSGAVVGELSAAPRRAVDLLDDRATVVKNAAIKEPLLADKLKFLEILPPNQDRTKYYSLAKRLYGAQ